jgi:hypothetical protein
VTPVPDAAQVAIPLGSAALCVDCGCIFDTRILVDTTLRTCRDHVWVRLSRWVPPLDNEAQARSDRVFGGRSA